MRRFRPSIRWRLAAISAGLTFLILCTFAIVVAQVTTSKIRSDFDNELLVKVNDVFDHLSVVDDKPSEGTFRVRSDSGNIKSLAGGGDVAIRILDGNNAPIASYPKSAPDFPIFPSSNQVGAYRVQTRVRNVPLSDVFNGPTRRVTVQYARKSSDLDKTIRGLRLFLILGVLVGTACALVGGRLLANRAMAPVAKLTEAAQSIARSRDPNMEIPRSSSPDEIGELAATLDEMLKALAQARGETEGILNQQRRFVADASHELRTPLTSVLANLELLVADLEGDRRAVAQSALRSSQRMRRLVADLLLLARADSDRGNRKAPTDMRDVLLSVAAELGPVSHGHELEVDATVAVVDGVHDDLYRMVLNLMENAINHTPEGTSVRAVARLEGATVELRVEDNGPGIPDEVRGTLFERFVRSGSDTAGSFGLGLSIVKAVAEAHGGTVIVDRPSSGGARFVVRIPAAETDAQSRRQPVVRATES